GFRPKYEQFDYQKQAKQELFETVKEIHACKQDDGQSVSSYLLKMKAYLDTLECLGYLMPQELGTIAMLHAIRGGKKASTPSILAIKGGKIQKDKNKLRGAKGSGKGKTRHDYAKKPKISLPPKKDKLEKDSICHHYKEVGH
nr:hypothetical protein [Tanacetum cinerariifolium]